MSTTITDDDYVSYDGFFTIDEHKDILIIKLLPGVENFNELDGNAIYTHGSLFISGDGKRVEAQAKAIYQVRSTHYEHTVDYMNSLDDCVHVSGFIISRKRWFKKPTQHYKVGTKYITNISANHYLSSTFMNCKVKLHTNEGK